jgi:tRNA pseudouridine38-40 synthase
MSRLQNFSKARGGIPQTKNNNKCGLRNRNFKLEIEYAGTHYYGWQVQNRRGKTDVRRGTIQETVEKTLQKILQEKIKLIVAGRTDSGVHALGQVANFKSASRMPLEKLHWALNCLLRSLNFIAIQF